MSLSTSELKYLSDHARAIRHVIIDTTVAAGGAHIGGALSMVEILTLLYFKVMRIFPQEPNHPERDRLVVSKGHGGVGLASVLAHRGYFPKEALDDFNKFKSAFGMHLDGGKVKGVDASTGSLGHGLSMCVGLALGARHQKMNWRTYCVLGDGECNEGSVWEAAMSAAHFKVTNLTTFVDRNRLMIDGPTEEIMGLEPFADKWKAFGWIPVVVDGHDFNALQDAISRSQEEKSQPVVIIANTVKGKGVEFMENQVKWHYGGLDSDLKTRAHQSVDRESPEKAR